MIIWFLKNSCWLIFFRSINWLIFAALKASDNTEKCVSGTLTFHTLLWKEGKKRRGRKQRERHWPPPRPRRCIHSGSPCSQEPQTQWPGWRSWRPAYWDRLSALPGAPEAWMDLTTQQQINHLPELRVPIVRFNRFSEEKKSETQCNLHMKSIRGTKNDE